MALGGIGFVIVFLVLTGIMFELNARKSQQIHKKRE